MFYPCKSEHAPKKAKRAEKLERKKTPKTIVPEDQAERRMNGLIEVLHEQKEYQNGIIKDLMTTTREKEEIEAKRHREKQESLENQLREKQATLERTIASYKKEISTLQNLAETSQDFDKQQHQRYDTLKKAYENLAKENEALKLNPPKLEREPQPPRPDNVEPNSPKSERIDEPEKSPKKKEGSNGAKTSEGIEAQTRKTDVFERLYSKAKSKGSKSAQPKSK